MRKICQYLIIFIVLFSIGGATAGTDNDTANESGGYLTSLISFDLKDMGVLTYITNEYINPALGRDPYSKFSESTVITAFPSVSSSTSTTPSTSSPSTTSTTTGSTTAAIPSYINETNQKLENYFSTLTQLTLKNKPDITDVTLAVMDDANTYYIKHLTISGSIVTTDNEPSENMVSITPLAARQLVRLLDDYMADGILTSAELTSLGNWGESQYKDSELKGKTAHVEAILNFMGAGEGI